MCDDKEEDEKGNECVSRCSCMFMMRRLFLKDKRATHRIEDDSDPSSESRD